MLQSAAFGVDTVQISRSADLFLLSNLLHVHVYFISTFIKDFKKIPQNCRKCNEYSKKINVN